MLGTVLLNPASGSSRGTNDLQALETLAGEFGCRLQCSKEIGDLVGLACQEARLGCPLIVAAGGDDTVREVLWGMDRAGVFARPLEERPFFGILPLGTFNNFARFLGLPADSRLAMKCAQEGVPRYIDLGRAGGRIFTESVGVGVDVAAWKVFPKESASMFRRIWDGGVAVLKAVTTFRPKRYFLDVDGQRHSYRAYHLTVANSSHFSAGFAIAPHAAIDDGQLDLCMIPAFSKLGFLLAIPFVFLGKHTAYLNRVRYWQVKRVHIASDHPGLLRIDGQLGPPLPAEIQVIPQALAMRLP